MAGFTSSLQIVNNQLWISYTDEGGNSIKVARADLSRLYEIARQTPAEAEKEHARQWESKR